MKDLAIKEKDVRNDEKNTRKKMKVLYPIMRNHNKVKYPVN